MSKVIEINHPIISDYMSKIRDKNTCTKDFREAISKLSTLIGYEATRNIKTNKIEVDTPLTVAEAEIINNNITIIPILRAGLGMLEGILDILPAANVGHIGLERDEETLKAREYYFKVPPNNLDEMEVFVVDPMLATGGSAVDAIDKIKEKGMKNITFLCIIAAPEGIKKLQEAHPDVNIYVSAIDMCLNEDGYIVPGLGDAGDRIFGTI